jgi:hypothetical protein
VTSKTIDDDETLLDKQTVLARYGGKSHAWLDRQKKKAELPFPQPDCFIGIVPHWRVRTLRRWEASLPTTKPPANLDHVREGQKAFFKKRASRVAAE